ncbi:Glycerophosphoryl diester phosphodiesterase, partial [Metarhizium majus ARSEF 297]
MLLEHKPDLLFQSCRGETALYYASQAGYLSMADLLVRQSSKGEHWIDVAEKTRGWTPLIAACANGHVEITRLLLQAGAKPDTRDIRGWTALEHAIFRGHHAIAEMFQTKPPNHPYDGPAGAIRYVWRKAHPVCNMRAKMLIVHLGSTQGGHNRTMLQLENFSSDGGYHSRQESPLELHISVPGTESVSRKLQLPVLDDQLHKPLIFKVNHDMPLQIMLKLCRCESTNSKVVVSSGTSSLDDESLLGEKHESLIRERTVYLIDKETSPPAGTVLLSYVVAKPFPGLQKPSTSNQHRPENTFVQLVGHRGCGQNVSSRSFLLQLGENTITSFLSAAKLGASFVEVTRDMEAVVYHDFCLSESGTDVPIHDLTLAQYQYVSRTHEPQSSALYNSVESSESLTYTMKKPRAWYSGEESLSKSTELRKRLEHTVDFQAKGFKPNSRGDVVQDSLTTLEELLVKLPAEIGSNIEIKYPRLHEAAEAGIAPVAININDFIDVALTTVRKFGGKRRIVLSSFTPEVCILLSVKQSAYPVMFITNAGKVPMQDQELRAASLQTAVHVARLWNLSGTVFACETFLHCPRLVQFVKNTGLICASYGLLNNDPANAIAQTAAGIDILMVDRVKLIADHLRKHIVSNNSSSRA